MIKVCRVEAVTFIMKHKEKLYRCVICQKYSGLLQIRKWKGECTAEVAILVGP